MQTPPTLHRVRHTPRTSWTFWVLATTSASQCQRQWSRHDRKVMKMSQGSNAWAFSDTSFVTAQTSLLQSTSLARHLPLPPTQTFGVATRSTGGVPRAERRFENSRKVRVERRCQTLPAENFQNSWGSIQRQHAASSSGKGSVLSSTMRQEPCYVKRHAGTVSAWDTTTVMMLRQASEKRSQNQDGGHESKSSKWFHARC